MKNLGDLGGDNGLLAPPPFAFASIVYGLNNRGQVTGTMAMPGNQTEHAFLWTGEKLEDLGTLGGSGSAAFRINGKGEVVGTSLTAGDNGEIVGQGMDPRCTDPDVCDFLHAFVLISCDENHPDIAGCDYGLAGVDVPNTNSMSDAKQEATSSHVFTPGAERGFGSPAMRWGLRSR
jgi:probable HAF family extracellular repeat protein